MVNSTILPVCVNGKAWFDHKSRAERIGRPAASLGVGLAFAAWLCRRRRTRR